MSASASRQEPQASKHAPALRRRQKERAGFRPLFPIFRLGPRLEAQVHAQHDDPGIADHGVAGASGIVVLEAANRLDAGAERVVRAELGLADVLLSDAKLRPGIAV